MKNQFQTTAVHRAVVQLALLAGGGIAFAQTTPQTDQATPTAPTQTIEVKGQRAALQSAQQIKQNAEEIVDSVVAEEAGKLPDKSITEVLQRVVGVNIQRQRSIDNDASHFSEDGSGIRVRGLSWGSSNLNGREVFSAGWPGRDLSWGAVPAELMVGVDTYKNPSAEQIEGGVSGLVNLRTALPFDYGRTKSYVSFGSNYEERSKKASPAISGLYSTVWDAESGHWGALIDLAVNNSTYESENQQVQPYFPRTDIVPGRTVWIPSGANWGQNVGSSNRQGFYGAVQWKKNDMQSAVTYFTSGSLEQDTGSGVYPDLNDGNLGLSIYNVKIDNPVIDDRGVLTSGHYSYPFRTRLNPDGTVNYDLAGKGANQFVDGGLGLGNSRSFNEHKSGTSELAWNFKWVINDRWAVQNDLQWVHSTFETKGREVQLATFMPSMDITVPAGTAPVQLGFDDATRAFLADPSNYYWNLIQPTQLKGDANLYAWKADAKFRFDSPVLRDLRFGFRASEKNSVRERATYPSDINSGGWQTISVPWTVRQTHVPGTEPTPDPGSWQVRSNFPYLSDPRYAAVGSTELFNFSNFYQGKLGNLPSVVFPTYDMMKDYPNMYGRLMKEVGYVNCVDGETKSGRTAAQIAADCTQNTFDPNLVYGLSPNNRSDVTEDTFALYSSLRFGFDDFVVPVEGNVGIRAVYTKAISHGFIVFKPTYNSNTPPDLPQFGSIDEPLDVKDSHVDVLPTLNLKFDLLGNNKLIGRFAAARSIYRPGFQQLQESVSLNQNVDLTNHTVTYTGSNSGNVKLKPLTADNFDLALEYYPRAGQSVFATLFYKDVKDIVYNGRYTRTYNDLAGNPQIFSISGPRNMARAWVRGIEMGADSYLDHFDFLKDKLPDWAKGFGVSANYTYIGSTQKFYKDAHLDYCPADGTIVNDAVRLYGCDTNGLPFGNLPLPGLTKNSANFALRYDRYGFSARLAYNWTARTLEQIGGQGPSGGNGTSADPARAGAQDTWWGLPKWQEAYGQLDGGVSYNFTDKFGMSLSVSNLNNVMVRETVQQTPGDMTTSWRFPGRSYYLSGRYEF
jgi:TonB-dependent receptor